MKKVIIILMLFLLSGCSVKYELLIEDNDINEKLIISDYKGEIPEQADIVNFSNHKYNKKQDNNKLIYETKYNIKNLKESDFLKCFNSYNFVEDNNEYVLITDKKFTCLPYQYNDYEVIQYDEVELSIKTNHIVLEHNADKVKGNTYSWKINKENIDDASIYMKLSTKTSAKNNNLALTIIFGCVLFVSMIIYLVVNNINNNSNRL